MPWSWSSGRPLHKTYICLVRSCSLNSGEQAEHRGERGDPVSAGETGETVVCVPYSLNNGSRATRTHDEQGVVPR